MAWNALAKGLKLADERSFPANRELWISARDEIFQELSGKLQDGLISQLREKAEFTRP